MAKRVGIGKYFELSYLTGDLLLKNLLFFAFLGFLGIVYIANGRYAEGNVREIQHLQRELKELRWYYLALESENMYNSRRTEMANRLREEGLMAAPSKPRRIIVDKKSYRDGH
jgi:hypothetical protein